MKISIIVPIYNQEKYLEECLNSLVNQDFNDYEIILIDDGSTDNSSVICKKYIEKYSFIKYIYQENAGQGPAKNTGIQIAKGEYLLFIDPDDAIQENCVNNLYEYASKYKYDLIYFDEMVCDENLNVEYINPTFNRMLSDIPKIDALERCIEPAHICSRMYKKELFDNLEFLPIWYEDMAIFPILLTNANKIGYFKVPIYKYRQHKDSITHEENAVQNLDVIQAWHNVLNYDGYNGIEKKAVIFSIKKSIENFMYFRPNIKEKFIEFYNNNFVNSKKLEVNNVVYNINFNQIPEVTYPLIEQLKVVKNYKLLRIIYNLEYLYITGGSLFIDKKYDIKNENYECLVLNKNDDKHFELHVNKGNNAVKFILDELRKINIISLKGEIKDIKLEKIIAKACIFNDIKIRLI